MEGLIMPKEQCGTKVNKTNQLSQWSRILLEKLTGSQLVKKFPTFYGIKRYITAFTRAATCPGPEPNPVHATSFHILKIQFNIILPSTPGSSK
jgi:hypothetical protein